MARDKRGTRSGAVSARPWQAVVVGATGAVGSALVRELIASPTCGGVVAVIRRATDLFDASVGRNRVHLEVADFAELEVVTERVADGCSAAFCTVGIGQPRKISRAEFRLVDVEYARAFARGAKAAGVRHISLLSAVGANAASRNWYLSVKGEAEQAVIGTGISRTSLFRPSLLVTRTIRYGLQDRLAQALFPFVAPLLPRKWHQIRVEDLAAAMIANAERDQAIGVETLHYGDFVRLIGERA